MKNIKPLLFLALILRAAMINVPTLWYDENFTLLLARLDWSAMIAATAGDVHPPAHYVIVWALFHTFPHAPEWAIRIPSLVFSMVSFYVFAQLLDQLHINQRIKTAALILMAVMPMQLWYAQEGRMYALLELTVMLGAYLAITRNYKYLWLAFVAMLYTQNYGALYAATICLSGLVLYRRDFWKLFASGLVSIIFYLPWAFIVAGQMSEIDGRYWIVDAGLGASLNAIYKQFWHSAMLSEGLLPAYFVTFAALVIGAYLVIEQAIRFRRSTARTIHTFADERIVILIMAFVPVFLAWFAGVVWQPILLFRPLIGTAPFLYLVTAWGVTRLDLSRLNWQTLYASAFAAPVILLGVGGYYQNISAMKQEGDATPILEAFAIVRENWQEGDVLYYTDDGAMINVMPYSADLPQYRMPECGEDTSYAPSLGSLSDETRAALGVRIAELDDVPHQRAWVFAPRSPLMSSCYEDQIAHLTVGAPFIQVDDNAFITSGIWLVENK